MRYSTYARGYADGFRDAQLQQQNGIGGRLEQDLLGLTAQRLKETPSEAAQRDENEIRVNSRIGLMKCLELALWRKKAATNDK